MGVFPIDRTNKKWFNIIIIILIILPVLPFHSPLFSKEINLSNHTHTNSYGWVEEINGVKLLFVSGSYYDMGYQHGSLLKEEVLENYRAVLQYAIDKGVSYEELNQVWHIMKQYVPEEYINETKGLADGCGLSVEEISSINMMPTVLGRSLYQCSAFSTWNTATADGELIYAKSYDYPRYLKDPITGIYIQENQAIMIRKPDDGYASLSPIIIGQYGSGGINEKGITMASLYSWTDDQTYQGTPRRFRIPQVMDKASNTKEAIDILFANRTIGFNTILSDATIPIGLALEETDNLTYVGTWNNTSESLPPFWSIKHVVRRSNNFINPTTASTQRVRYDPSSLFYMIIGQNDYYPMYTHYKALSKGLEKYWGNITVDNSLQILREVYQGKNNLIIYLVHTINFIDNLAKKYGYLESLHQMSAHLKSGEIRISFADNNHNSWENEIHCFNFYDLLEKFSS